MKRQDIYACKELSAPEKQVFMWLSEQENYPVSIKYDDMADALSFHKRSLLNFVNSLEAKGFIQRTKQTTIC